MGSYFINKLKRLLAILLISILSFSFSINTFAEADNTYIISESEEQHLAPEIVDRLFQNGVLDEQYLHQLKLEGVFGPSIQQSAQNALKPDSRGIGTLKLEEDGNYVVVKCFGFDSGTISVDGEVLIINRAGDYKTFDFYFACSGLYNKEKKIYFTDWYYASISRATVHGANGTSADVTPSKALIRP